ncbi:MAG: helix-turn-helix protein, partial [Candidatus Saccharibacteria bacterium]|nr:helix-turn-helix protein [Candidatus Saccharibacteria bacterium]
MDSDYYVKLAIEQGDEELRQLVEGIQKKQKPTSNREQTDFLLQLIVLRHQSKLSQTELAKKVGMPQSSLARIESGKNNPTLKTLLKIATALGSRVT